MMIKWRTGNALRVLVASAVLAGAALPAGATTLRRMDFGELVQRADRVVYARAAETRVYRDVSGTRIYTDTIFDVIDEAKGRGPARLTVTFLGGADGNIEMLVEGTPAFHVGEEVVLFTTPAGADGRRGIIGFSQGVMRVTEDADTGEKVVSTEVPAGVHFVEDDGAGLSPVRPAHQRARLTTLMDHVRRVAAGELPSGPSISRRPEKAPIQPPSPDQGGKP